jgi:hypothetical protein
MRQAIMMNVKDSQRMEACIQQVAEILYRNTSTTELTALEGVEQVVRAKILEEVSPKIAMLGATHAEETSARLHPLFDRTSNRNYFR